MVSALYCFIMVCVLSFSRNNCNEAPKVFSTLREAYDFWAPNYKHLVENTSYCICEWIRAKENLLPRGARLVLDLGCADGFIGKCVCKYRSDYTFFGIDFSNQMIQHCSKNSHYQRSLCADLNQGLPTEIAQFKYDIVFATGCLEFIQNHDLLLTEIRKILKPGGLVWFTLQIDTGGKKRILDTDLNLYTCSQAKELLRRHNLMILDFEVNPCAYKNSSTQEAVVYCMIIAYCDK